MEAEDPSHSTSSWKDAWNPIPGLRETGWVNSFAEAKAFIKRYEITKGHFIGDKKTSNFGLHDKVTDDAAARYPVPCKGGPGSGAAAASQPNPTATPKAKAKPKAKLMAKVFGGIAVIHPKPMWTARPANQKDSEGLALNSYCVRFKFTRNESSFVPNDGVPFIILGTYVLNCMYGRNKHESAQRKMKAQRQEEQQNEHPRTTKQRQRIQGSRKSGCPANIIMKEVLRFPQFRLKKEEASSLYAQGLKSREVREAIRSSTHLETEHRIYICVPKDEDHQNKHPIGMLTGSTLKKDLINKVQELVGQGVTNEEEMKRRLKIFVESILFPDPKSRPTPNDTAYYPTDRCIRNHIYTARMKLRPESTDCRVEAPPIKKLNVRFTPNAEAQLTKFWNNPDENHKLEFLQNYDEAHSAIEDLLSADPCSVHRRKSCADKLYYFTIDNIHITSWFGTGFVEVLQVQPIALAGTPKPRRKRRKCVPD